MLFAWFVAGEAQPTGTKSALHQATPGASRSRELGQQ
jgi:hypothetical protein